MSRTTRTHMATDDYAARRNTRRKLKTREERGGKSAKAHRKGQRNAMRETRKEYTR